MPIYKLANPDQHPNNMFKITEKDSGCCVKTGKVCRNVIKFASLAVIGLIRFICKDKEYSIDLSGAETAAELNDKFCDLLSKCLSDGGMGAAMVPENNDGGGLEIIEDPDTGEISICLDTDIEILGGTASDEDGTEIEAVKICDKVKVCKGQIVIPKDEPAGDIMNASTGEIVTLGTYPDGATALADVQAAFGTLVIDAFNFTVEEDLKNGVCIITFETTEELSNIIFECDEVVNCGCKHSWANEDGTPFEKIAQPKKKAAAELKAAKAKVKAPAGPEDK